MRTDSSERIEVSLRPKRAGLVSRITRLEWGVAAVAAVVLVGLTVAEPDILQAPFENGRTVIFTFGAAALGAAGLVVMLRLGVPPVIRLLVVGVPFVAVSWWLLSPFFVDDVVDDEFSTSIADATRPADDPASKDTRTKPDAHGPDAASATTATPAPGEPTLLGAGRFVGLAGHDGMGDAGFFALDDDSVVLRLENFDIQNGPDLRLYVVPGADQTDPGEDSLYLGELRGNVGNQTYELPTNFVLTPRDWTVLVWCEAFRVEFVAATVTIS